MKSIENTKKEMSILKNDERLYVYLQGNHFQQNNVLTSNNDHILNKNVVNVYTVYKLDPLASTRDTSFTMRNALFGAMQITKNATDNSKNNYKGMVYVLMKEVSLVIKFIQLKAVVLILQMLETF